MVEASTDKKQYTLLVDAISALLGKQTETDNGEIEFTLKYQAQENLQAIKELPNVELQLYVTEERKDHKFLASLKEE